jgi:branched-chain amino acid transport system permease protein
MDQILGNVQILRIAPLVNVELLVNGVLVGAIFALIAYGMALVWGVMNIINVSQGAYVILGGYVAFFFLKFATNLSQAVPHLFWVLLSLPVAAIAMAFVSLLIFFAVIRRILDRDLFVSLLATFGIELVLQQLMNQVFSARERVIDSGLATIALMNYQLNIPGSRLLGAFFGVAAAITIVLLMRYSRFGQTIRATAQNPRAARIMGIDTNRVYAATYALNGAICGVAGAIVGFVFLLQPFQGLIYTLRSFAIVILAGISNIAGVIFAGLGLGIFENFSGFILGPEWQNALVFLLVPVALLIRMYLLRRQRKYLE